MRSGVDKGASANLVGSLWMTLAMAAFAVEDALLKGVSGGLPVWQMLVIFGLGGSALFAGVLLVRREPLYVPDVLSPAMRIRMGFEVLGRLFYTLSFTLIPLSVSTVILQAAPVVVVLAAALVLGEKVGWRRWTAICIGLLGVVVIVQPGGEAFSALSLLAVLGMIGFAGRDLASRVAPATLGTAHLGLYGFLAIVAAGGLFALWEQAPVQGLDLRIGGFMAAAIVVGSGAYVCLMRAMRTGDVSAVTPFRYTRLLFGIALGVGLFGEAVTPAIWIGSGLVVVAGLVILWRGRQA